MSRCKPMIAVMHYVPPDTLFNDDMKLPYGYWAWSYVDDADEKPEVGDSFSRYPGLVSQQKWPELESQSYVDCLDNMLKETESYDLLYIRHKDGNQKWVNRLNTGLRRLEVVK